MSKSVIEIPNLGAFIQKLNAIGKPEFLTKALEAGAVYLAGKVATYPPVRRLTRKSVYGQTFQSDKQRFAFFGKLKRGEIQVPYTRGSSPGSETLGKKWTIAATSQTEVVIGNNVSYAPFVQSQQYQSMYMRAVGWQTAEDVVARESETVIHKVEDEIAKRLKETEVR